MSAVDLDAARAADTAARLSAQTEFGQPLLLEAGAGTGKTTALTARIVAWCLGPGWHRARERQGEIDDETLAPHVLERVVAITFTEAAAAEMANRVARALVSVECGERPPGLDASVLSSLPDVRRRARALLAALDHLVVRTIHAFCRRLLAAHPLEAGLHPGFQVDADGGLREQAVREVLERRLSEAYSNTPDPALLHVAEAGLGPGEMERALLEFLEQGAPADALDADPFSSERIGHAVGGLVESTNALLACAAGRLPTRGNTLLAVDALGGTLAATESARETGLDSVDQIEALTERLREIWDPRAVSRVEDWARGKFLVGERSALGEDTDAMAHCAREAARRIGLFVELRPRLAERCRQVVRPLLLAVHEELRARGVVSFAELLWRTRDLLERHGGVTAGVRESMDQLLVDEFQDTDRMQCRIVELLALEGEESRRPGLFLVGDPKQSIYGWRSADLQAYERFRERVEQAGGRIEELRVNFRSVPAILDEVALVMEPVMRPEPGLQPDFVRLVPSEARATASGFAASGAAPVEHWVSWPRGDADPAPGASAAAVAGLEAAALANDLRRLHDRHSVRWSSIGVLFRSRGDLDTYLSALREADVPYAVQGDRSYYQRREIIEIAALVRCILDPNDHLSLLTSLRWASVGVPDAALIPLWTRQFPALVTHLTGPDEELLAKLRAVVAEAAAAIPEGIPGIERIAGWERSLVLFLEELGALRASFANDPADVFVERMRHGLLFELTEAGRFQGQYRLANLDLFLRRLTDELSEAEAGTQSLLQHLRARVAEAFQAEEGRPREACDDAVQILTIHQAKGLDFDHVYLMQLQKGAGGTPPRNAPVVCATDGGWEYRLMNAPTLGLMDAGAQRERVARAELVRTLYVAMTRARERLVLSGGWPTHDARLPAADQTNAHMDLLRRRRVEPPDLEALASSLSAGDDEPSAAERGALWVFPALALAVAEPARPAEHPALAGADAIRAQSRALAQARGRSDRRMGRAYAGAASAETHQQLHALLEDGDRRPTSRASADPGTTSARTIAVAIGSAVHLALESMGTGAPAASEIARAHDVLAATLEGTLAQDALEAAVARGADLLDRFARGPLYARLRALDGHVVARELPLVAPPGSDDGSPVGFISGAIDLVYRDPADGAWVVVDYKTDRVEGDAELQARVDTYAHQGAVYAHALQEALALEQPPRVELWFLHPGAITVPGTRARSAPGADG